MNMRKEGCAGKSITVIQREANDEISLWTFVIPQCFFLTEQVFAEETVQGSTLQVHIYTRSGNVEALFCQLMQQAVSNPVSQTIYSNQVALCRLQNMLSDQPVFNAHLQQSQHLITIPTLPVR